MLRGIHKYLDKSNWEDAREALKHEDVSVPGKNKTKNSRSLIPFVFCTHIPFHFISHLFKN